jgi:hypothetical protein
MLLGMSSVMLQHSLINEQLQIELRIAIVLELFSQGYRQIELATNLTDRQVNY